MKKEIRVILKDIVKLFLFLGGLLLIVLAMIPIGFGIGWLSTNRFAQVPILILVSIICIGFITHLLKSYWKNVKKRAKKEDSKK